MSRRDAIFRAWIVVAGSALLAGVCLDERTWPLAVNTMLLSAGSALIAVPWGILWAVLLTRMNVPGKRALQAALIALLFFPLYLQAAGWTAGWGKLGWQTMLSGRLDAEWLRGWGAAIWLHGVASVPWAALIVAQALRSVEAEVEEAALLDGSPAQVIRHVTLRRIQGAAALATLWITVLVAGEMTVSDLFQIRTFAEELYVGFALGDSPLQVIRAVSAALFATTGLAAAITLAFLHARAAGWTTRLSAPQLPWNPPWTRWLAAALLWLSVAVMLGAPAGNLLWQVGAIVERLPNGDVHRSWSALQGARLVWSATFEFRNELRWTLVINVLAAGLAVAAAAPLAWLARRGGWRAGPALILAAVCLATPGPLWGLASKYAFNRPSLGYLHDYTVAVPVCALALRCLPLTLLVLWQALQSVPREVWEAAELDGAGPSGQLRRVAIPLRGHALLTAWVTGLAVAQADLGATILVLPPGVETVSRRLYGLIHSGVPDKTAALCLLTTALYLAAAGAVVRLTRPLPQGD